MILTKILLIYQNIDVQTTFDLIEKKAREKVRGGVVTLWDVMGGMLVVKWNQTRGSSTPIARQAGGVRGDPERAKQQFSTAALIPNDSCRRKEGFGTLYVGEEGRAGLW